jgi:anti-sigma B factor antagonist
MALQIDKREVNDITIVELKGKVTIGSGDVELRDEVIQLLEDGKKKLILNLENLKYMDSSGVGELVSTFTTVSNKGGQLKLTNLSSKIFDLLQITQLLQVFDVHESVDSALQDFE